MQDNTILLVEDNADDEALALRALRHSEFVKEVVVVRDGAEAITCLATASMLIVTLLCSRALSCWT